MDNPGDGNHLSERAERLLLDWRFDFLEPDFKWSRWRLNSIAGNKSAFGFPDDFAKEPDPEFIEKMEYHIQFIDPHYETWNVEGEERQVFVITKRDGIK